MAKPLGREKHRKSGEFHFDCVVAVRIDPLYKIRIVELLKPHAVVIRYGRHFERNRFFAEILAHTYAQAVKIPRKRAAAFV